MYLKKLKNLFQPEEPELKNSFKTQTCGMSCQLPYSSFSAKEKSSMHSASSSVIFTGTDTWKLVAPLALGTSVWQTPLHCVLTAN